MKKLDLYEEKYNKIISILKEIENSLDEFNKVKDYIKEIDKYYTSNDFLKDYDDKKINNKYAILSEDGLWNMFEKIGDLQEEFNDIINEINDEK